MRKYFLISLGIILFLGIGNSIKAQQNNSDSERFMFDSYRTGSTGAGVFVYKDANTSVSGELGRGLFAYCVTCFAGDSYVLRSSFQEDDASFADGNPGLVNGRLYPNVYFSGSAFLNGGTYRLPYRWTRGRFTIIFPATLTSQLNFHTENFGYQNPTVPFYTKQLSLQGTVTATLEMTRIIVNPQGEGVVPYFRLLDVKYDFSNNPQINNENIEKDIQ